MIDVHEISTHCTRSEFVGTAVLDTIGLVISGIDDTLLKEMNVGTKYHCLGLFSSRTGAAGQLTAIDDAVKATNTEVLSIELPRDTKGWGGHGNYIVLGGSDVSDVRHAISMALELTNKYAGEVYISESGHLEFAYSASAGQALNKESFKKYMYALELRQEAAEHIGIENIRRSRLQKLQKEKANIEAQHRKGSQVYPDFRLIMMARLEA